MQANYSTDDLLADAKSVENLIKQFSPKPYLITPDLIEEVARFRQHYDTENELIHFQIYLRTGITPDVLDRFEQRLPKEVGEVK